MRYLSFTYVDAVTGRPINEAAALNGPAMPAVAGLQFGFALESKYPTTVPLLYGSWPDDADIDAPGVFQELSESEYLSAREAEMALREIQQRSRRIEENNRAYDSATLSLTADYPQLEKDTWPTQNEQATAWVADPANAITPWIDRAAAERGIDREDYLRRTLVKAEQFKVMSAFLTGRRQRYEDQIKAGNAPVLDYALTPDVLAELQQITETIMSTPAAGLQEALA